MIASTAVSYTHLDVYKRQRVMNAFDIDEIQAEYVAEIKLRHLNREYILKRIGDIETLEREIAELERLVRGKGRLRDKIIRQLKEISNKYGRERKTRLIAPEDIDVPEEEDLVPDYNTRLFSVSYTHLCRFSGGDPCER